MIDSNLLLMGELVVLVVLVAAGVWSIFNRRKPAKSSGPAVAVYDMRQDGQRLIFGPDIR